MDSLFIDNKWLPGNGTSIKSLNPANQNVVWQGNAANKEETERAIASSKKAFSSWSKLSLSKRSSYIEKYVKILDSKKEEYANTLNQENGKPLWEAYTEVAGMIGKYQASVTAYDKRTGLIENNGSISSRLEHRPIGVMVVFGPFNFPGHLPNGHIIPALLAGNTVVFKPSELTPKCAELMVKYWEEAGLPSGVLNLVQGGSEVGVDLVAHADVNGVLFTGSYRVGKLIHQALSGRPEVMLALEMGGNNPLIVDSEIDDIDAAVYNTIQSAFITAGQRCTCARRLYVQNGNFGNNYIDKLVHATKNLAVSDGHNKINTDSVDDAFMGPVISLESKQHIIEFKDRLLKNYACDELAALRGLDENSALLTPGIILLNEDADALATNDKMDQECFGPLLQIYRYDTLDEAIRYANKTQYGLSAGLFSDSKSSIDKFYHEIRAGIVNWNRPTTGAVGSLPFGGIGHSGNFRASAYYAADYCSYPVASQFSDKLVMPETLTPGVKV